MTSTDISNMIVQTATKYGFDPRLALEVGMKESSLNPNVPDSPAGAIGIFQLMPATAAELGVDPRDPAQNIDGGIRYLMQMISHYSGNVAEGLAAFDWGPGNMDKAIAAHGAGWMNYAPIETQDYVQTILGNVQSEYSVSVGTPFTPAQGDPNMDSTATEQASVFPSGWTLGTALWVGGAILVGWVLFSLLE